MKKKIRRQKIDTVFVLIIFCVFAISVLMVLMLGASIYKNMSEISRDGYDERTVLAYFWTKVKNGDDAGNIYIGDFHGIPALCFDEVYTDSTYVTMIYHFNGQVYELFTEVGYELGLEPEDGESVMKVDNLRFEGLDNGLIRVTVGSKSTLISPRGKTGISLAEGGISG